jgi:hypothetical protein
MFYFTHAYYRTWISLLSDSKYLHRMAGLWCLTSLSTIFQSYRTVVHTNIKLFVALLYISFGNTKDFDICKLLSSGDIDSKYEW